MRHRVYGRYLGRNKDQREALFRNLVQALIIHGTIKTSESKAKAIKGLVDKVINLAKEKRSQTFLQSFLTNKNLRERLVKEIVPKLGNRGSGYTSLMRLGPRLGDQTMMVRMSLIGAEELEPIKVESRVNPSTMLGTGSQESRKEKQKQTPLKTERRIVKRTRPTNKTTKTAIKRGGKKS